MTPSESLHAVDFSDLGTAELANETAGAPVAEPVTEVGKTLETDAGATTLLFSGPLQVLRFWDSKRT